jgi:membrane-bound serine protease (ClpP class)
MAAAGADEVHEVHPVIDVVEVSGLLDPVLLQVMTDILENVDPAETIALVFQVDSRGSVVSDEEVAALAELITNSPVPVSFWVGPSGSRARGAVAQLVGLADDVGIAPGARFGDFGEPVVSAAGFGMPFGLPAASDLVDDTVGYEEAIERGLARPSPVLLEHLRGIPGFEGAAADGTGTAPVVRTRFHKPGLVDQLFHTAASPPVAYLLFLVGAGLLVFELYTAGVGIAGVIGAGSFLLGCYGLAVLPTRWWAIALLVVAMFGYAVDIQTGVPRAWTLIATACLVVGSVALYDGVGMSWITLGVGFAGTIAAMAAGMPAMVRTRFSTPTIGRDWMIGESGEAVDAVGPEGTVRVREAVWKARTNRATPIDAGAPIRVVAVEGLWLEVAPEEGGARDYRSRSPKD